MDCRALPFRQLPHQSKLFLDYVDHFDRVAAFYSHPPSMNVLLREAKSMDFPRERRLQAVSILRRQNQSLGAGAPVFHNLDRLEKGAVAIVSGQQVGLFGGPAYAVYKALMAVQIAQELTQEGIDAVPVFWMATEDHDLEEVRHSTWFHDGKLTHFELPAAPKAAQPVGRVSLGPAIDIAAQEASDLLSKSGSELLAGILRECYRSQETYGTAFGRMFARLFAEKGLILLEPLDPGWHRLAAPVYRQAVEDRDALNEKLLERGKSLEKTGFSAQVKVTAKSTLLFYMADGSRQVVTASNGKFQAGAKSWTREELMQAASTEPENFSPNALLRPVLQDYLLPTAGYVAGPAEICYFAQSEVLYRQILRRMPVMLPRAGFTLVDSKAAKLLRRYELTLEKVWSGSQEVRARMECKSVPKNLAADFERSQKQIKQLLAKLEKHIATLDPTLKGSVETAQRKINYQLEKLRRKTGRAQDEKQGLVTGHERYLESLLYPHKMLQSRELCLLPFLAHWGPGALGELQALCTGKNLGHHFILQLQ